MARNRSISPDLWTDDKVMALSQNAILVYIGLISMADDEGRLEWKPVQLASRIFGLREGLTVKKFSEWMEEIAEGGLVVVYEVDGKKYAYHPAWFKHQYVNKPQPSKIPLPPDDEKHSAYLTSRTAKSDKKAAQASATVSLRASEGSNTVSSSAIPVTRTECERTENVVRRRLHVPSDSDSDSDSDSKPESDSKNEYTPHGVSDAAAPESPGLEKNIGAENQSATQPQTVQTDPEQPALALEIQETVPKKRPTRSERDLGGDAIKAALAPLIVPLCGGMTRKAWQERNHRGACELHDAGYTPEQVVEFWQRTTRRDGSKHIMLSYLLDDMARDAARRQATPISSHPKHPAYGLQSTPEWEYGFKDGLPCKRPWKAGLIGFSPQAPPGYPREMVQAWLVDHVDLGGWERYDPKTGRLLEVA